MITFIILIILITVGAFIAVKSNEASLFEVIGGSMVISFTFALLFHLAFWLTASYGYNIFFTERTAFEQTLNEARKNGYKYETAAIIKDVGEWNKKLAKAKYNNSIWFFDPYVDDRVEQLQPIK